MRYAGFWIRSGAYCIDIVPIVVLNTAVFYLFFGFDETWEAYVADRQNLEARVQFLKERNWIRELSFIVWIAYCSLMEASPLQGTFGKAALGLRVVAADGSRLTMAGSVRRNLAKIASSRISHIETSTLGGGSSFIR